MWRLLVVLSVLIGLLLTPSVGSGAVSSNDPALLRAQSSWTLDTLAADAMGGAAVMLYGARTTTGEDNQTRTCVRGTNGALNLGYCDVVTEPRKWLLDSSGQIRLQADPTKCWEETGDAMKVRQCDTNPPDTQVFQFNSDSTITTPSMPGRCLNSTFAVFRPCEHPIPASYAPLQWRLEPAPNQLVELQFTNNSAYVTANTDGSLKLTSQLPGPNGDWYLSPVPQNPGQVYIHTYPAGDCLTATSNDTQVRRCSAEGYDSAQRWLIPTANTIERAIGGYCLATSGASTNVENLSVQTYSCNSTTNPQNRRITLQTSPAKINVTLTTTDTSDNPVCLLPSQTSLWTHTASCDTQLNTYLSTVDIFTDGTIHFQTTQNCLANPTKQPEIATQEACNSQQTQAWNFSPTPNPNQTAYPTNTITGSQTLNTLTPINSPLGAKLSTAHTQTRWTLQPTPTISHCLDTQANRRGERSPQGVGLSSYLTNLIDLLQHLPGAATYGTLPLYLTDLQEVQAALAAGSPYTQHRASLQMDSAYVLMNLYAYYRDGSASEIPGVSFTPQWIRAEQAVESVAVMLLAGVNAAPTDDDLDARLWGCVSAPAPLAY